MNTKNYWELEANSDNLKEYFDSVLQNTIMFSLNDYIKIIKKYSKAFFEIDIENNNFQVSKKIADEIHSNINIISGFMINKTDYLGAASLLHQLEFELFSAVNKKLVKYISWIEYSYTLAYLLHKTDDDYEAINKCWSITSEYFNNMKEVIYRIKTEEDNTLKDTSDYSIYLNYLVLFSKLSQSICEKAGIRKEIGKFYFNEKLFSEKLLYMREVPPFVYQMTTLRSHVHKSNTMSTVVLDESHPKKGFKLFRFKLKYRLKAISQTALRWSMGYGEKPFNLIACSFILILLFGLLLFIVNSNPNYSLFDYLFQSMLTFTSFGFYGNIISDNTMNRFFITIEIFFGIIFINGFIVTLARKVFR